MEKPATVLEALGGEAGCRRLSEDFYTRVGKDPCLRPLFPGKSLRCATEEFAAFLIQFLGGNEDQTQYRWWLSLHESHARFRISPAERSAWMKQMQATLEVAAIDDQTRQALSQFFVHSSAYVIGKKAAEPEHEELAARWREQRILDATIEALTAGRNREALSQATRFESRPSVFTGVLARMVQIGDAKLIRFVTDAVRRDPSLAVRRFSGRTLLHFACAAGSIEVVTVLLRTGADPNVEDRGGHTPLYSVANECSFESGPDIVRILMEAGADVNAQGGVTRATALHMAARRGYVEITRALLDCGARIDLQDRKGDTPLDRALKCRRDRVLQLLIERGAPPSGGP